MISRVSPLAYPMQNIARPPIVALLAFLLVFVHEQLHAANPTRVPAWVQDAVFYQIFPERFRNGDPTNDPDHASLEDPDAIPVSWKVTPWTKDWYARDDWERKMGADFYDHGVFHRRYGGDLQGIIDKLDYLKSLGINTIYLNPVFYARSMHKYDGNSFHHVDPHFGPDPKGDFELLATETARSDDLEYDGCRSTVFRSRLPRATRRGFASLSTGYSITRAAIFLRSMTSVLREVTLHMFHGTSFTLSTTQRHRKTR